MTPPPVAPAVVADVLDALPPRLRKRVDAALDKAAAWQVVVDGDGARAELDADTALTWVLRGGVLASADDLTCTCLLAPKCLHRGVAVAAAEVAEVPGAGAPGTGVPAEVAAPVAEVAEESGPPPIREDERSAAAVLWEACATVLRSGASGSGAVVRAGLLRAVHVARVAGLHRASSAGLRIASMLADARAGSSSFDRELLTAELVELLLLCHDLRAGVPADPAELRGTARREYRPIGALRLYGLCTEPVVTSSGYAGVVTHLVDDRGGLWTVPAIMPGGRERVVAAAGGPVAIGESGLTQAGLGRGGLLLSGGTASPDRRLGAGKAVRAVAASGATWDEEPLAGLWRQPLAEQVDRAFRAAARPEAHRPPGDALLFAEGVVRGPVGAALRVQVDGGHVDLVARDERTRDNLRVLSGADGLRVKVVARLLPERPGAAVALALSGDVDLPSALKGRADLGLDRVQRSHVARGATHDLPPDGEDARPSVPPPLRPLENVLHRVTLGGRAVAGVASTGRDVAALRDSGLRTTAALLEELAAASRDRERDAFGRVVRDAGDAFPHAWLRAGLHVREFTRAAARRTWVEVVGGG
ncbi:hypothetical protein [Actinosynnema mirum]|uniref:SWIM-type domain-containing protein n=1 Tax=Actinosynnema mirum (strain ATCC 29888 / DSM 43827 / JCM 3225 / NBRC 14064 / NCIMB 13271 / NRRL B-12336 / IMRU 3971 / 101) TaxID=446462 RepID=C6WL98_ACTMD|nr:hypothetical protein [Actinosynnema mirum]ACU36451.1 hypothetical protein Amir_2513 [Actinosynnema mirum DSM 43827]